MSVKVDTVKTDHFAMDYCSFGDGQQPFVILPGVSVEPVVPLAEFVEKQYKRFHADYKCYLFDRRHNLPADYSVEQMADDTAEAMRQLGVSGACVYGRSQGGMMGIVMAAKYPELVKKLVVTSSAAYLDEFARNVLGQWAESARQGNVEALINLFYEKVYSDEWRSKYAKALDMAAKLGTEAAIPRLMTLCNACLNYDGCEFIRQIKCDCFVIGSKADNVLGYNSQTNLATLLACPSKIYEGYSHAVYDEAPDLQDHILAFFSA